MKNKLFTEKERNIILDFARKEIQFNTYNPFEATLRGVQLFMAKYGYTIVKEQGRESREERTNPRPKS